MNDSIYVYDTETCGFHGPVVLIQYQLILSDTCAPCDDIHLHEVWHTPISETLKLIEDILERGCIGFNLVFDHFHLCQLYTTLLLLKDEYGDVLPIDYINEYADLEPIARDGPCLKPRHSCDIMLYAQKGPYQSTMERKNITVRKIPRILAKDLQSKLEEVIKIDDIYFERRKEFKEFNWDIEPNPDDDAFCDLTLRFKPSAALKVLAKYILNIKDTQVLSDIGPGQNPLEYGWAPFAKALGDKERNWRTRIWKNRNWVWGYAWPGVIKHHISYWRHNSQGRKYAHDDVVYTRDLYKHFKNEEGSTLKIDDNDSILACQVAACRWKGFKVNLEGAQKLRDEAVMVSRTAPIAPNAVWEYIEPYLSIEEKAILKGSTKKEILKQLADSFVPCVECSGTGRLDRLDNLMAELVIESEKCHVCNGSGNTDTPHPVAPYAIKCIKAREATKEVELWDKLLIAGRFHVSNRIIGALTGRMSGSDQLNPQGIKHAKYVRQQFPLAFEPLVLSGGDFMSFEVSIIAALCNDVKLNEELSRCAECKYIWPQELYGTQIECPNCGKTDGHEPCRQKFHGLFAMGLNPGITYDEVVASKGTENDLYDKGKRGGFAKFYGGNEDTLVRRGVADNLTVAAQCLEWFDDTFKGSRRFSEEIYDDYCSMRQEGGIGTAVTWKDPKEYVESMLGFRRYFTIENRICKKLFDLAQSLPKAWKDIPMTCLRRDREQKVAGAIMSALYAAAFSIQAKNMRAASNHRIQSTGATITKELQVRLWSLQPVGVHHWRIMLMNVHDELMMPILPELRETAREIVRQLILDYRELIPLIAIGWADSLESWADK